MGKGVLLKAHRAERLRRAREERERLAKECGAEIQRVCHSGLSKCYGKAWNTIRQPMAQHHEASLIWCCIIDCHVSSNRAITNEHQWTCDQEFPWPLPRSLPYFYYGTPRWAEIEAWHAPMERANSRWKDRAGCAMHTHNHTYMIYDTCMIQWYRYITIHYCFISDWIVTICMGVPV